MLKRLLVTVVFVIFALSLVGCKANSPVNNPSGNPSESATSSVAQSNNSAVEPAISRDRAKEIAFEHAGVKADSVYDLEVEPDRDFGTLHYEVDFESGGYDYSYDIDAQSGEIINSEKVVDR